MRSVLFFCLTAIGILPLVQAQKHPFTFEDMMALKRVEEPQPSPDGKWVLFAAVDVDLKANTKTPHVWVVTLDGAKAGSSTSQDHSRANDPVPPGMTESKEREIISDQDADRPRWAPDGKRFAFVSSKENGSQIWIADFDGATGTVTAKQRLTNIATEADGELWSPDGKNILFKSNVYPECDGKPESEAECNAKKLDEKKNSKLKAQVFTHLLYRHWNAYKEGKRTHLFLQALPNTGDVTRNAAGQELIRIQGAQPFPAIPLDLTPGDYDAPVFSLDGQDDYAFSPDGKEICYASNHDPDPAISTNNDLWIVPVTRGQAKNITAENKAADNTPLYSPDDKYIAYRAQARPGYESDRWRLMLYDRKTGEKTELTKYFDQWVETLTWNPDSTRIYFSSEESGRSPIYSVNTSPERLITGFGGSGGYHPRPPKPPHEGELGYWPILNLGYSAYYDDLALAPGGNALLFTQMSVSAPNEIYSWGLRPL